MRFPAIALSLSVLISGCIYSSGPLLDKDEYVQPIRSGRWEQLLQTTEGSLAKMTPEEKRGMPCHREAGKILCSKVTTISRLPNGRYELQYGPDIPTETIEVAPLSDNHFIIQQIGDEGKAKYSLGTITSPDRFEVRQPRCDRDAYLRTYSTPDADDPKQCRVRTRQDLTTLFKAFAARSRSLEHETYMRLP